MNKFDSRAKRAKKTKEKIKSLGVNRLVVFRTPKHIYAQVIDTAGRVLAVASSLEKQLRSGFGGNITAASQVGTLIGERAVANGITSVAFDRNGFKYHGRIKALADNARESGLKF